MTLLEALKSFYEACGGDTSDFSYLDSIDGNRNANVISVIYGDGFNTKLPRNIVDSIYYMIQGIYNPSTGIDNIDEFSTTLYAVPKATTDEIATEGMINQIDYGLSGIPNGSPMSYENLKSFASYLGSIGKSITIVMSDTGEKYIPTSLDIIDDPNSSPMGGHYAVVWRANNFTEFGCDFLHSK